MKKFAIALAVAAAALVSNTAAHADYMYNPFGLADIDFASRAADRISTYGLGSYDFAGWDRVTSNAWGSVVDDLAKQSRMYSSSYSPYSSSYVYYPYSYSYPTYSPYVYVAPYYYFSW